MAFQQVFSEVNRGGSSSAMPQHMHKLVLSTKISCAASSGMSARQAMRRRLRKDYAKSGSIELNCCILYRFRDFHLPCMMLSWQCGGKFSEVIYNQ
jgi:hypothetical protein